MSELSKKEKAKSNFIWDIYDYLEIIVMSFAIIFVIYSFFFRLTVVEGESMEDTLHDKDLLFISDFMYTPQTGDIVVLHDTSLTGLYREPLVKRVIATGGQVLDIDFNTWTVTVDGEVIDEPYIKLATDQTITSSFTFPMTIPENEVFVMGDNRNHSGDSRSLSVGTIDERCIIGKAYFRVRPLSKFGNIY